MAKTMNFSSVYLVDVGEALGLYHAIEWLKVIGQTLLSLVLLLQVAKGFFLTISQTLGCILVDDKQM